MKVKSEDTTATYSIRLDSYQSELATEMTEGIYEFISIQDSRSALYYSYKILNGLKSEN